MIVYHKLQENIASRFLKYSAMYIFRPLKYIRNLENSSLKQNRFLYLWAGKKYLMYKVVEKKGLNACI